MSDDRDPLLARALRDVPVPEHGPGFWVELESRLSAGGDPATVADVHRLPPRERADLGRGTEGADEGHEGSAPIPLAAPERRLVRRSDLRLVTAAAVVVVVLGALVVRTVGRTPEEQLRSAAPPPTSATATSEPTPAPASDAAAAQDAVVRWLEAVGRGDVATAAALTGPRSIAYAGALTGGAGIEGFLVEAGEGYGAWADSPDRRTTAIALDQPGEEIVVVVVSGTWTGEGGTMFRDDPIPAVRGEDGIWRVEPWAIEPSTGGRIDVISPLPGESSGFGALAADGELEAVAPAGPAGTFHFSVDDAAATAVTAAPATGGRGLRSEFDPGDLSPGAHRFVIAYVAGNTVTAVAGSFTAGP